MMKKFLLCFFLLFGFCFSLFAQNIWRCGTIAPPGSEYEKIVKQITGEIKEKYSINVRLYLANSFGDEIDVAEQMKYGELDCGILTGNGFGYLSTYSRVVEIPFLIRSRREWKIMKKIITPLLTNALRSEGWELLGLFGIGEVYFVSKHPIEKIEDFSGKVFWVWNTNIIQVETFEILKSIGVKGIELSVLDVRTFADKIDILWGPLYALVAFGWYRNFRYIITPPILFFPGGVVVSQKKVRELPEDVVNGVREIMSKRLEFIEDEMEKLDKSAYEFMLKSGMREVRMRDIDKLEVLFKSRFYDNFKKYVPSWLITTILEKTLKMRMEKK